MEDTQQSTSTSKSSSYLPPPLPPTSSLGHKRSALELGPSGSQPATPPVSQCLPCETAVSRSIDQIGEVLASITPAGNPGPSSDTSLEATPKRRRVAIELATTQEDGNLSAEEMVDLVEVMRHDVSAVDTYLSLSKTSDKLHCAWVKRVIKKDF